jgi:hypothetical protein
MDRGLVQGEWKANGAALRDDADYLKALGAAVDRVNGVCR